MRLANIFTTYSHSGFIAGTGEGIVTALGKPASREVFLLRADSLAIERITKSSEAGNYIFVGVNGAKEYMVMARDYKRELEPFAWDYVKPANDLTIAEQQALWASWQT